MIRTYIMERKSWIFFFLLTQLIVVLVCSMDTSIPLASSIYIVFLNSILFVIFFIIRYNKETKFYQSIEAQDINAD
ncbi:histidine kinase, partial [Salmonella enterica subsp. enterica serovar Typhimurium]